MQMGAVSASARARVVPHASLCVDANYITPTMVGRCCTTAVASRSTDSTDRAAHTGAHGIAPLCLVHLHSCAPVCACRRGNRR